MKFHLLRLTFIVLYFYGIGTLLRFAELHHFGSEDTFRDMLFTGYFFFGVCSFPITRWAHRRWPMQFPWAMNRT